jgi:hypothetical protein
LLAAADPVVIELREWSRIEGYRGQDRYDAIAPEMVQPTEGEMTSLVADLQYLELAEEYYQAFRDLPPNGPSGKPISWPRYFALCHAIELALNAFLLAHGMTEQQLKSQYGHNISALIAEAINIDAKVRSDIKHLTEPHQKYWPRYPRQSGPAVAIDQLEGPSVELLKAVRLEIRGGNPLHVKY